MKAVWPGNNHDWLNPEIIQPSLLLGAYAIAPCAVWLWGKFSPLGKGGEPWLQSREPGAMWNFSPIHENNMTPLFLWKYWNGHIFLPPSQKRNGWRNRKLEGDINGGVWGRWGPQRSADPSGARTADIRGDPLVGGDLSTSCERNKPKK